MQAFIQNIESIYGEKGKDWLKALPEEVRQLEVLWGLDTLMPLNNLSYNYVLSGFQNGTPIVLKLGLDMANLSKEAKALEIFKGSGTVVLLDRQDQALLLQRAMPGIALKSFVPKNNKRKIEIACEVIKKLRRISLPQDDSLPHIEEWLAILDQEWIIPKEHLYKARAFKNQLLGKISATKVLLHGDLHQDNILSHGEEWLAIDPKGVIGFPINEVWTCVEDLSYDLNYISDYFNYPFEDVVKWYYVHAILAACWRIEDGLDPVDFLNLAKVINLTFNLY